MDLNRLPTWNSTSQSASHSEKMLRTVARCFIIVTLAFALTGCADKAQEKIDEGMYYLNRGETDLAQQAFEDAVETSPDNANAQNWLGLVYQQQGEFQKAIDTFNTALELYEQNSDKATILSNIGLAYEGMEDKDEAAKFYRQAIDLDANSVFALVNLGTVYFENEEYEKAVDLQKRAARLQPNNYSPAVNLIEIYFAERNWEKVIEQFQVLQENFNQLAPRFFPYAGFAHLQQGNLFMAKNFFSLSTSLNSNSVLAHAGLALVHAMDNTAEDGFAKAMAEIEKARGMNPEAVFVYRMEGLIHEAAGNPEKAKAAWEKGLEVDPKNDEIKGFIANLETGTRNLPEVTVPVDQGGGGAPAAGEDQPDEAAPATTDAADGGE